MNINLHHMKRFIYCNTINFKYHSTEDTFKTSLGLITRSKDTTIYIN